MPKQQRYRYRLARWIQLKPVQARRACAHQEHRIRRCSPQSVHLLPEVSHNHPDCLVPHRQGYREPEQSHRN